MPRCSPASSAAPPTRCSRPRPTTATSRSSASTRKTINTEGSATRCPRAKVAQLVDNLTRRGRAVIAFDVIYRTEQTPATTRSRDAIDRAGNVILARGADDRPDARRRLHRRPTMSRRSPPIARATEPRRRPGAAQQGPDRRRQPQRPARRSSADGRVRPRALARRGDDVPRRSTRASSIVRPNGVQIGDRFVPDRRRQVDAAELLADLSDPSKVISAADVINGDVRREEDRREDRLHRRDRPDPRRRQDRAGQQVERPPRRACSTPTRPTRCSPAPTSSPVPDSQTLLWVALITAIIGTAVLLLPLWASILITLAGRARATSSSRSRASTTDTCMNFVYPSMAVHRSRSSADSACATSVRRASADGSPTLFSQYVPEAVAQRLVDEDRAGERGRG